MLVVYELLTLCSHEIRIADTRSSSNCGWCRESGTHCRSGLNLIAPRNIRAGSLEPTTAMDRIGPPGRPISTVKPSIGTELGPRALILLNPPASSPLSSQAHRLPRGPARAGAPERPPLPARSARALAHPVPISRRTSIRSGASNMLLPAIHPDDCFSGSLSHERIRSLTAFVAQPGAGRGTAGRACSAGQARNSLIWEFAETHDDAHRHRTPAAV